MRIWVGIAALVVIVVLFAISRAIQIKGERRRAKEDKPVYQTGGDNVHHAIAEWALACERSLAWSRKRRNKEGV